VVYNRATGAPISLPGFTNPRFSGSQCTFDAASGYIGSEDGTGTFTLYERSSGTFISLPTSITYPAYLTSPVQPRAIYPTTAADTGGATGPGNCSYLNPPTGPCTLRQALQFAAPGDTVSLAPPAAAGRYTLTHGQLELTRGVTISGAGALKTTIAGNGSSRIFDASALTGTVTISGVTITGGSSPTEAGALLFDSAGQTINLRGVALSGNSTGAQGGAVDLMSGTLNIDRSTIGPLNVAGTSTSTGNGGAIYNGGGTLSVTNSTISLNRATDGGLGGGIFTAGPPGTTNLSSSTLAFNTVSGTGAKGGNIYVAGGGAAVKNTIIADGSAPGGGSADCFGTITSNGHNLTDGVASTGVASCSFTQPSDILADARLGPLRNNGGQTNTHALAAGSPAIDHVPATGAGCPATDQRGVKRPKGVACDIGALEAGGGEKPPQWSVAQDFRVPPNQSNPSPDSLGHIGVWSYEQAPRATPQNPATYSLVTNFSSCTGDPTAYLWDTTLGSPIVGFSDASAPKTCPTTATLPSKTLFMTPASAGYAVLAWKSPVQGIVRAAGSFQSDDPGGGSGIRWFVDKNSTKLVAGSDGVGGGHSFDTSQAVTPGDVLYFLVGPAANNVATHDTTELNLTITQTSVAAAASADRRQARAVARALVS
jgi:hypothetical protein